MRYGRGRVFMVLVSNDVFLCHTSADKKRFVEPLIAELDKRGITYWYDKAEIKWGDRISSKVDEGLRISRYVLVFLSENFIGRNWPEAELASALSRENDRGEIVVLPLVTGDKSMIFERYQLLRGKTYLECSSGISAIVDELQSRLQPSHNLNSSTINMSRKATVEVPASKKQLLTELLRLGALLTYLQDSPDRLAFATQMLDSLVGLLMRGYGLAKLEGATSVDTFLREIKSDDRLILKIRADMQSTGVSLDRLQDIVAATKRVLDQRPINEIFSEEVWGNLTSLYGIILNFLQAGETGEVATVMQMIAQGESQTMEFKSSLRWDVKEQRISRDLAKAAAKEVAAFMNSAGGTLLVGVRDDGEVLGLAKDIETLKGQNEDSLQRFFDDIVGAHCGKECYEYIASTSFVHMYDKTVLVVKVRRSEAPIFFVDGDKVDLLVRISSTTKSFNVREAIDYYRLHWQKQKSQNINTTQP